MAERQVVDKRRGKCPEQVLHRRIAKLIEPRYRELETGAIDIVLRGHCQGEERPGRQRDPPSFAPVVQGREDHPDSVRPLARKRQNPAARRAIPAFRRKVGAAARGAAYDRCTTVDLFQTKSLDRMLAESAGRNELKRSLGPVDLVALGVGAVVGAGIFTITGVAASANTGPGLVISFVLAAIGCSLAGLCYSEFATMIPIAGSAYTYAYASFGELWAWIIGWDLILEYSVGAATVAIGWSQTLVALLASLGVPLPAAIAASPFQGGAGGVINLPAVLVVIAVSLILILGIRE